MARSSRGRNGRCRTIVAPTSTQPMESAVRKPGRRSREDILAPILAEIARLEAKADLRSRHGAAVPEDLFDLRTQARRWGGPGWRKGM